VNPALVQMLCDAIDDLGCTVLWSFLVAGGMVLIGLTTALFIGLAIRRTIRYLWRRMAEGSL